MTNGLQKYDFLYDNNTFSVSSISGLRDFNKYTMDPSSRTRAGSLQTLIKVVYGSRQGEKMVECFEVDKSTRMIVKGLERDNASVLCNVTT